MANDEFDESDCSKDKTRILSASSAFKMSTEAGYLTSGIKKDDQATKKGSSGASDFKYLTPDAKKAFNLLWHAFI